MNTSLRKSERCWGGVGIERSRQRDEGRGWGAVAKEKQQMESDWERVRREKKKCK